MAGITKSVETIQNIGEIVVDVATLFKAGFGLGSVGKALEVLGDLKELYEDGVAALPELTDVDSAEAGQLASEAYVQVKRIVAAVLG